MTLVRVLLTKPNYARMYRYRNPKLPWVGNDILGRIVCLHIKFESILLQIVPHKMRQQPFTIIIYKVVSLLLTLHSITYTDAFGFGPKIRSAMNQTSPEQEKSVAAAADEVKKISKN